MLLLTDYPSFWEALWTMALIFCWIIWFWLLITVFADLFRRHDTSGGAKVLWVLFVIILPYLGVLVYLLVEHDGMAKRSIKDQHAAQAQLDQHIREVAPHGSAAEIEKAKSLLDSGTINQEEFDALKAKALAH